MIAMVTFILSGCTEKKEQAQTEKNITIKFFGYKTGNEIGAIPALLERFEKENKGVKVEYEAIPTSSGYKDVIKSRLAADEPLDVFMGQPSDVGLYKNANYIYDLSGEKWVSNLNDTMKKIVTFDEKIYSLPLDSSGVGMFCNLKLLKENGQKIPANWNEFIDVCQALKAKNIVPLIMGDKTGWHSLRFFIINGGLLALENPNFAKDIADKKIKPSEIFMPILNKVELINKNGYTNAAESLGMQWNDQAFTEYTKGKSAFLFGGTWQTKQLKEANSFDFTFVPIPLQDSGEPKAYVSAGTVLYVNQKTKNIDLVKKFLDFWADDKNLGEYVKSQNGYTVLKGGTSTDDGNAKVFGDAIREGKTISFPSGLEFLDNFAVSFAKGAQGIITRKSTPEQVGKELDEALDKALSLK